MVILLGFILMLLAGHLVYVNFTLRKDIQQLESTLSSKIDEIYILVNAVYKNQERKTLADMIKEKQTVLSRKKPSP